MRPPKIRPASLIHPSTLARAVGFALAGTATATYVVDHDATVYRKRLGNIRRTDFADVPCDRSGTVTSFDGTSLYYEEAGPMTAKTTVVFIHGYSVNQGFYYFQRKALCPLFGDRARFVFFDLRAHGKSGRADADSCTIDALGKDLYAVIKERIPNGKIVLIGHSMGGMSIMALAQEHPELFAGHGARVAGVGLLATSTGRLAGVTFGFPAALARLRLPILPLLLRTARTRPAVVEHGRQLTSGLTWALIRRLGFVRHDIDPDVVEYITEMIADTRIETIADFYGALMSHDKLDALPILNNVRCVVMCGDEDAMTPLEHSRRIAEQLDNVRLVVIPHAGHGAPLEAPEPVNDALAELIAGTHEPMARSRQATWRRRKRLAWKLRRGERRRHAVSAQ